MMENKEYVVVNAKRTRLEIENQLNDWHVKGYDFVTIAYDQAVYRKSKKHKKD